MCYLAQQKNIADLVKLRTSLRGYDPGLFGWVQLSQKGPHDHTYMREAENQSEKMRQKKQRSE